MQYKFTVEQLQAINNAITVDGKTDPRDFFRKYHNLGNKTAIQSDDLEDFFFAYRTQYELMLRQT